MKVLVEASFKASLICSVLLLHHSNKFKLNFDFFSFLCYFSKFMASLFKIKFFGFFLQINSKAKEDKDISSYRLDSAWIQLDFRVS